MNFENRVLIIFGLMILFMIYSDLHPNTKFSKDVQNNNNIYVVSKSIVYIFLIRVVMKLCGYMTEIQLIYPEPDPLRYRGVFICISIIIFSFFFIFFGVLYILFLSLNMGIVLLKKCFSREMWWIRFRDYFFEDTKSKNKRKLVTIEFKALVIIFFIVSLLIFSLIFLFKGYFEAKDTQDLYKLLIKDPGIYSYEQFQITVSYVIKDLNFYTSFFSILALSFLLPITFKMLFRR